MCEYEVSPLPVTRNTSSGLLHLSRSVNGPFLGFQRNITKRSEETLYH